MPTVTPPKPYNADPLDVQINGVKYIPENSEYVEDLEAENAALKDQLDEMTAENDGLKTLNGLYRSVIGAEIDDKESEQQYLLGILAGEPDDNGGNGGNGADTSTFITLSPLDPIQDYLISGSRIYLSEGIYQQQLDFSGLQDVVLMAHPDANEGPVTFTGLFEPGWLWRKNG